MKISKNVSWGFLTIKENWPKNNPKFYPLASPQLFLWRRKRNFSLSKRASVKNCRFPPNPKRCSLPHTIYQLLVFSLSWVILLRQSKHLSKNTASCSTSYSVAFPCQKDNNSKLFFFTQNPFVAKEEEELKEAELFFCLLLNLRRGVLQSTTRPILVRKIKKWQKGKGTVKTTFLYLFWARKFKVRHFLNYFCLLWDFRKCKVSN